MKRTAKTIFAVTCDTQNDNEYFDLNKFKVKISKGTTGAEMGYAIAALLSVVLAHEHTAGNDISARAFLHSLTELLEDASIGVPKNDN